ITSEPVVGKAISTRAKRRSSPSARIAALKGCLTPPTLSERRFLNSYTDPRHENAMVLALQSRNADAG
ncbi:MAG: hypothetical protein ACRD3B_16325, partial [Candidatus Sulfotelmatobacter sp.]